MESDRPSKNQQNPQAGIALFMVIAAMTVLSVLVTEFVYIAQVNQRMAFDGLDRIRALYLAKSGLKISLLRLKAYQNIKPLAVQAGAPRSLVEKIWNFPFIYPIPTEIPGLTMGQKDQIQKFTAESGLTGSFTAVIESESSRFNLNQLLERFTPTPNPSPSPSATPNSASSGTSGTNSGAAFDPEVARTSLQDYLQQQLINEFEKNDDFAQEYRNFRVDELVDSIAAWIDRGYQRKIEPRDDSIPSKGAPIYGLSELHMISGMDDRLYDLFSPTLTASLTQGINVNTLDEKILRSLVPEITDEEVTDFFKFRDDPEQDNQFKKDSDFFKYLSQGVQSLSGAAATQAFQSGLTKRGLRIVTDESVFKITVQATVNQATRRLIAYVELGSPTTTAGGPNPTPSPQSGYSSGNQAANPPADAGLRITFMRIL